MDRTIFHHARRDDLEPLRKLSTDRLHVFLREFLAELEKTTIVDEDTLTMVGASVARSEHAGADEAVLAWLVDVPTSGRLALTSAFLDGYWLNFHDPPDPSKIKQLLTVMQHFTPEDSGWRFAANTALLLHMKRSDLPGSIRNYLRRVVKEFRDALAATDSWSYMAKHFSRYLRRTSLRS